MICVKSALENSRIHARTVIQNFSEYPAQKGENHGNEREKVN